MAPPDPNIDPAASWKLREICPKDFFEQLQEAQHQPEDYNHLIARTMNELCSFLSSTVITPLIQDGGVAYYNDVLRTKKLSTHRATVVGAYYGLNQSSRYLKIADVTSAGSQGFFIPRPATITGMWAKSRSTSSWTFEARKNGVATAISSISVSSSFGSAIALDVDLSAGDHLQLYLSGTGIDHPIVACELAWRLP